MHSVLEKCRIPFWISTALVSCVINVMFLEKLISAEKNSSNLITFASFLLLSLDGFIFTSKGFTKKPAIPLKYSALLVCIFFLSNVANNLVYRFHVPITLHMIFKSGSLLTSLILGVLLLKRSYATSKYASIVAITVGIILCTYASTQVNAANSNVNSSYKLSEFIIGIVLLLFTLISGSYMGVLQERLASKFGKHPRENLFYNHALPLPFFAFLYKDIAEQITIFSSSEPMEIPYLGITMPYLWVLLICNTVFQYVCINSVFQLTSECTSLTVTLVITIRKFLSLIISIFYFGNPFTPLHWCGAVLVFSGSAIFADLHTLLIPSGETQKETNLKKKR